ncbi:MAG: lipocalin family protein [Bacteroidales bacterium]
MKKLIFISLMAATTILSPSCTSAQDRLDRTTVESLDLDRYLGTWYEIARFPHSFEKDLQGVTATYSYRKDGKIKVLNQGYKGSINGPLKTAVGKAKVPDPNKPSELKVSFFLFFYADYLVLELEPNYQWALVGSSSENFLWILSRTPVMEPEVYDRLVANAKARGYDVGRLQKVSHR